MKRIKYLLLLLFIVLLTPNAYCYDYDVTNIITSPRGGASTGGRYLALEIYNTGSQNVYSVNTRYNGTLSNIEFNLPLPAEADNCFTTNMEYTITMEMATSDWRNHFARPYVGADSSSTNWATSNVTFVSQKKIYFKFKIPASESLCYGFVYVRLNSSDVSSTAFTGVTNWNLNKITLSDQYSSSGGGSSGGSTPPTPTPNPNQNIIDNDNENTNNIIENNNQNTQNIIDNQNELLGNKCDNLYNPQNVFNGYINTSNSSIAYETSGDRYSAIVEVEPNTTYTISKKVGHSFRIATTSSYPNNNTQYITTQANHTASSMTITTGSNIHYLVIFFYSTSNGDTGGYNNQNLMVVKGSNFKSYCEYGSFSSKLDDTNAYLTDDSDPNISDDEFTSLFNSVAINNPLSSLLQLPVQFINAIVNQSNTCQVVNLGTLLGVPITLPCIDIGSIIGSTVWNTIDILSSIGLIVLILKQLYESITNALTLGGYMDAKKGGLGYSTPLEFLCDILTIGEVQI